MGEDKDEDRAAVGDHAVSGDHIAGDDPAAHTPAAGEGSSLDPMRFNPYEPIAFFPHKCPNCGAALAEDAWFCEECGYVVSSIGTGNPDPGAEVQADPLKGSSSSRQDDPTGQTDPAIHADTGPARDADLSERERLAARDAYVPEPTYPGPSPLAIAGGIAAVALVGVLLVKPSVFGLPAVSLQPQPHAAAGSADGSGDATDGAGSASAPGDDIASDDGSAVDNDDSDGGSAASSDSTVTLTGGGAAGQDVTYTFVHETMTWAEAEQYCEAHGGQLAQPTTKEAWRAFRDLCDGSDAYVIYLGAQRQADGTFAWLDGSPVDIKVWGAGEPNNVDGVENRLAYLRYSGGGAIYDVPDDPAPFYPDGYIGFVMQTA